jgi:hypothetical protein
LLSANLATLVSCSAGIMISIHISETKKMLVL